MDAGELAHVLPDPPQFQQFRSKWLKASMKWQALLHGDSGCVTEMDKSMITVMNELMELLDEVVPKYQVGYGVNTHRADNLLFQLCKICQEIVDEGGHAQGTVPISLIDCVPKILQTYEIAFSTNGRLKSQRESLMREFNKLKQSHRNWKPPTIEDEPQDSLYDNGNSAWRTLLRSVPKVLDTAKAQNDLSAVDRAAYAVLEAFMALAKELRLRKDQETVDDFNFKAMPSWTLMNQLCIKLHKELNGQTNKMMRQRFILASRILLSAFGDGAFDVGGRLHELQQLRNNLDAKIKELQKKESIHAQLTIPGSTQQIQQLSVAKRSANHRPTVLDRNRRAEFWSR